MSELALFVLHSLTAALLPLMLFSYTRITRSFERVGERIDKLQAKVEALNGERRFSTIEKEVAALRDRLHELEGFKAAAEILLTRQGRMT